jgi:hypothetical protein
MTINQKQHVMKSNIKNILTSCLALCALAACDPKEDRDDLPEPMQASALEFSVTQKQDYDNIVYLESKTKGVLPFWDYGTGFSNKAKDTINIPFAGTYYIKYTAYAGGGPVQDSMKITVTKNDPEFFSSPMWNLLTNGAEGKTWVWAMDTPGGAPYGNGSGGATAPEWWKPTPADVISWGVADDQMTFDLKGAANYTKVTPKGTTKGLFVLDTLSRTIKILGSDISNGAGITYVVVTLNQNELTLAQQGDGWRNIWMFKRKGFNY